MEGALKCHVKTFGCYPDDNKKLLKENGFIGALKNDVNLGSLRVNTFSKLL
jgi:hypothetical protein